MGGIITLTIRKKDGSVHKTSSWTNSLPYLINNIGIEKETHFDDYLNSFTKRNKEGDLYSSEPFLAPIEYGLVVIDYLNNEIVYASHYCSLSSFSWVTVNRDADHTGLGKGHNGGFKDKNDGGHAYSLAQFLEQKRLVNVTKWNPDIQEMEEVYDADFLNKLSLDEFTKLFFKEDWDIKHLNFNVQMGDFKVTSYDNDADGLKQLKEHVLSLGFVLTEEEEKIWNERTDH